MHCELLAGNADFRSLATIPGIQVDLRYASANNFVGRDLYGDLDCRWLHREAAQGLELAVAWLKAHHPGVTLLVLDALRPHRVQETLWQWLEGTDLQLYLADPKRGSIHSFGMAVDVTLLDVDGMELDMGTDFDGLDELSHPQHEQRFLDEGRLTADQVAHRLVLRHAMTTAGFHGIPTEWWHFDFGDRVAVREHYMRID